VRSPGSQHGEITHMHRFSDPARSANGSRKTPLTMLPSADPQHVGTPCLPISRLNSLACTHPEGNASLRPHGTPTHGQGHRDSLDLRCRTLPFPSLMPVVRRFRGSRLNDAPRRRQVPSACFGLGTSRPACAGEAVSLQPSVCRSGLQTTSRPPGSRMSLGGVVCAMDWSVTCASVVTSPANVTR
jgi:hypothetical protein